MKIDYSRDDLLTDFAKEILRDRYMLPEEKSPQDAFARAAKAFADDEEHAQRLYDYASKLWFMFSTPILSNGGTTRGLPISCFLNYVPDSRTGLAAHYEENIFLSSVGGGIGGYWGAIRSQGESTSIGNKTTGVIPFMHVADSQMLAFNQGATRRGSYAAYIDISHPEVEEFLIMRKPTGGDVNRKNLNLHHGINVTDDFMQAVVKGEEWPLVDPNSKKVTKIVDARELWHRILEIRYETGEPYIHFIDTSNRYLPEPLKEKGLRINNSNLCSEIYLPTAEDRTAVCCLSSVNLEKYDEWGTDMLFIEDLMRMLDNVLTYFIEHAPAPLWRAVASAKAERSVGLGAMGWHAWLQKNGIPFESPVAVGQVHQIHKSMFIKAHMASKKLAAERGEAPDMVGTGLRFAHMFAVAPNASSSIICGTTSPSIEPWRANAFAQKTLSGSFLVRNPYLEEALLGYEEYKADVEGFWSSVYGNKGSVQHVEWLSDAHKEVFKTATEIDQHWVIEHAVARQQYIDQGQSVNLFFPEGCDKSYINSVHLNAWKGQLKGLYYLRSEAVKRAETVSKKVERVIRPDFAEEQTCLSCEG
jgi:ribonucleoside-diphosphate reductase alpha chain